MVPSVSDIKSLVELVPLVKTLVGLPKRLAEMERRLAALEGVKAASAPDPMSCYVCGLPVTVTAERADPLFPDRKTVVVRCEAGHESTREVTQAHGFR